MVLPKCSRNHFISEKYKKKCNHLSYISFKTVPLCKYTGLPTTVNVLETFLGAILWKPFQLFRRINVSSITKAPFRRYWFQSMEEVNNRLEPGQKSIADAPVSSYCSLLRNPWPKPTGVLEHCREGETNFWCSIFRGVSFWPLPKATKDVRAHFFIHSFPHAVIPVNYTHIFRERFAATTYL